MQLFHSEKSSDEAISSLTGKLLRIMKLTAILLLSACMVASAKGLGQQITLSEKNAPLQEVFVKIEKQSGYTFAYTGSQLAKANKVSIEIKDASLEQVLQICFANQPFSYSIIEKTIVVRPKQESPNAETTNVVSNEVVRTTIDISGKVTDEDGNPLAGASVKVKGTKNGTTTDANGFFVLKGVDDNAVLEISFIGFEMQTQSAKNKTNFLVSLKRSESPLDVVQVIAYGQTTQRYSTGNIATVKAEEIAKQPVSNVLQALEGRVPGLQIQQATGFAGSGVTVRIQGVNSITNGKDPLYVVDGVPYVSQMMPSFNGITGESGGGAPNGYRQTYGSPLNFINPADIESVEILKDADATAIYGSQAANGAILITTKKGKSGDQKIEFNLQQGWGMVTRKLDLLNTRQYLDMRYEAFKNDAIPLSSLDQNSNYDLTVWDTTRNTDWQKTLIGNTAHYTDLQANVSGGTSNIYYSIAAGYHKETTVLPGDFNDQKATMHFQVTSASANKKFRVSLTGSYMADLNKLPFGGGGLDLTMTAIQLAPDAPALYNADGTINWALNYAGKSTWGYDGNPVAQLLKKATIKSNNLVSNCVLNYQLAQGLNIKSSFGYTRLESNETLTFPLSAIKPEQRSTTTNGGQYGNNIQNQWIIEPQISYQQQILKGKLDAVIGSTFQQRNSSALQLGGSGYISDDVLDDIRAATSVRPLWNYKFNYKYNAFFARVNYNWQKKYIFNLTGRRDGSSRFGENNRFHNFGAVGAAWIFTEENFVQNLLTFLSFGKIKGSYGTTGSDQLLDYQYLSTFSPITSGNPYQGISTLRSNGLSNPYLQWEETRKFSIGLDLGFLKDRILINSNYYRNRSSNQLIGYRLPSTTGFGAITRNFPAEVQNTGLELAITTVNVQGKIFNWP